MTATNPASTPPQVYVKGLALPRVRQHYPKRRPFTSASSASARWRSPTTTRPSRKVLTRADIESRPPTMWRYAELLPHRRPARRRACRPASRPLVRADRLAKRLGVKRALGQERRRLPPHAVVQGPRRLGGRLQGDEFGFDTVACASTGNLANATAAKAAAAGLAACVLIPLRPRAGQGPRHQRLRRARRRRRRAPTTTSTGSAPRSPAATAGGSSTSTSARSTPRARRPTATRSPSSSAGGSRPTWWCRWRGGSLVTKIGKAFGELDQAGPRERRRASRSIHGAQAAGCAPIADMVIEGRDQVKPGQAAEQDRQVAGHRQPGRRLLRAADHHRLGRLAPPRLSDEEIVEACACSPRPRGSSPRPPAA